MRGVIKDRCLGSLFGDVEQLARVIRAAVDTRDVTVWLNAQCEIVCSSVELTPKLAADHLLGTYGIGAECHNIREDLLAFRKERVSSAIIF